MCTYVSVYICMNRGLIRKEKSNSVDLKQECLINYMFCSTFTNTFTGTLESMSASSEGGAGGAVGGSTGGTATTTAPGMYIFDI